MIKLNYTKEMNKQDKAWEVLEEDTAVMGSLFQSIMDEAKKLGFKYTYVIYQSGGERNIDLYKTETQENSGEAEVSFGYCKPLISYIEDILNEDILDINTFSEKEKVMKAEQYVEIINQQEEIIEKLKEKLQAFSEEIDELCSITNSLRNIKLNK